MPAKNHLVSLFDREPSKVVLKDIKDINKTLDQGKFPVQLAYQLTFSAGKQVIVEETTKQAATPTWEKKFYVDKNGYTRFTYNQALLAITAIFKETQGEKFLAATNDKQQFDINKMEGQSFDLVIVETNTGVTFIDWMASFRANGVEVPNLGGAVKPMQKAEADTDNTSAVVESGLVDNGELPF